MIPLHEPDLRGAEREYLISCINDGWVSSAGPLVPAFEARIAELSGRRQCVATASGTSALHLALVVLGVKPGDLVALPDWTFAASANAVRHAGAEPLFLDVSPDTWLLDPDQVRQALSRHEGRIGAILFVYALGLAARIDEVERLAKDAGVPLLVDAAGALGATVGSIPAGKWGKLACYSFNGNKIVTTGGGGAIVSDDPDLADSMRALSAQSRSGADYVHTAVAWNYRMPNINAALGLAQLERLPEMLAAKKRIAEKYDGAIAKRLDVVAMPRHRSSTHNNWLYSVRVASEQAAESLVSHLHRVDIQARTFWRSLSSQPPYRTFPRGELNTSLALSGTVVSLPCSSSLQPSDQARVLAALESWRGPAVPALQ
jgi:perosamine synthetase